MGTFRQAIEIALRPGGTYRTLEALVDTGATYTWIPEDILREMGAEPEFEMPFVFADGRRVNKQVTTIRARVDGRERYTPCIWGDASTTPLLGVVTLEEMGLGVDPVNRRLIEVPGLLMGAQLRYRLVPASDPKADPYCRLTREDGQRREVDTGRLFDQLAEQRPTASGHEFVFRGDPDALWNDVTLFVDEESQCCPFFTYEQVEREGSVLLRVARPAEEGITS